jgi:hypothetical protein
MKKVSSKIQCFSTQIGVWGLTPPKNTYACKINLPTLLYIEHKEELTHFGISVSRFQAENFVMPGVEMRPL